VILGILYCSLGWYERHTSVRPAAVVGGEYNRGRILGVFIPSKLLVIFSVRGKYLSTLRASWKYISKLRRQRKFSALLGWFLLSGIVLVAFFSLLKSRLKSVQRRRRRRWSLQQPITVRKPCATCPHPPADMPFVTFAHERSRHTIITLPQRHLWRHWKCKILRKITLPWLSCVLALRMVVSLRPNARRSL